MPILRVSLVRLSLFLSLALQVAIAVHGDPVAAAASVNVVSSQASPSFPDSISFELSAEVDGNVDFVDLVYLQASLETFQVVPAEISTDDGALTAFATADLATYFLPAGIDLTYHWVVTMADGEVVETNASVVTWLDDRFEWDLMTIDGAIQVYSYDRSEEFLEFVREVCEASYAELSVLYGITQVEPIRIWMYESDEDFAGTLAANSQEWIAGSAYPDLGVIQAVVPEDSESEVRRVLPHEISHQLLHQATINPYTVTATWIDEGLAVVAQTGGKDFYRDVVADAYNDDELLSLRGLISAFPFDPGDARKAYAQSFLVMEFVLTQFGPNTIEGIIEGYRAGLSHDEVLERALGLDTDGLAIAWIESLASSDVEEAA